MGKINKTRVNFLIDPRELAEWDAFLERNYKYPPTRTSFIIKSVRREMRRKDAASQ